MNSGGLTPSLRLSLGLVLGTVPDPPLPGLIQLSQARIQESLAGFVRKAPLQPPFLGQEEITNELDPDCADTYGAKLSLSLV